jgi:methionyl-tRNA formyltransferase
MEDALVRVVAVTQSDPFFTGTFFSVFLEELPRDRVQLEEIVVLPNFNETKPALARRLVRLYGAAGFVRLGARYARARLDERRGLPRTVEAIAAARGVPVRFLRTINDADYLEELARREVDVLLSVAAPEIFKARALRSARLVLNVHAGRLPQYRGMMPTFWALLNGDDEIVVSVHEMAPELDAGPVLAAIPVTVEPDESAFEVAVRAKRVAGREVARLLALVGTDSWPTGKSVTTVDGAYYRFPGRRDARRLRASGRRLL